jgi:hypothetical protein
MKAFAASAAIALSLLLAACGSAAAGHPAHAASAASATAAATSPPATLSAADQRFISAYQDSLAAKGQQTTATAAQITSVGKSACRTLSAGAAQSAVLAADGGDKAIIRDSEKYLCPAYLPKLLIRLSGSGIENSRPFLVPSGTVTVHYSYDCEAAGGSGNFIADLETGNQAAPGSDDQSIANALSPGGSATTTVYPQDPGSEYHVAVNSECSWSLVARSG